MMTDRAVHPYKDPPVPQLTLDTDPPVHLLTGTDPPVPWRSSILRDPPVPSSPQRMTMPAPAPAEDALTAPSTVGFLILQAV